MDKAIAPALTHTGSVGGADRVYQNVYCDNLSNGTDSISVAELVEAAASGGGGGGGGGSVGTSNPARFMTADTENKSRLLFKPGTMLPKPDGTMIPAPDFLDLEAANDPDYNTEIWPGSDYWVYVTAAGELRISWFSDLDDVSYIGGFHLLCEDAGENLEYEGGVDYDGGRETLPHPLAGYAAGDILPASVWCLNHRPYSKPDGMVFVESLGFWCDIYLAGGMCYDTHSWYDTTVTAKRAIYDFMADLAYVGKTLLDATEFAAAMLGSNEGTVAAGVTEDDADYGLISGGRVDTAGRRMISIYGVEDGCGLLSQFLRGVHYSPDADTTADTGKGTVGLCGATAAGGDFLMDSACGSQQLSIGLPWNFTAAWFGARGMSRHVTA